MVTNCCVKFPTLCCLFAYMVLIGLFFGAYFLKYFELNDEHYRDFLVWNDQATIDWDMREAAHQTIQKGYGLQQQPVRTELMEDLTATLLYQGKDGQNLLDKSALLELQKFEQKIRDDEMWKKICLVDKDSTDCSKQAMTSSLSFLEGLNLQNATQDQINMAFFKKLSSKKQWQESGLELLYNHRD